MTKKTIDFFGKRKVFFTISLVLIAVIAICTAVMGAELSINFKGGTLLTYSFSGTIDHNEVKSDIQTITGSNAVITEGEDFTTKSKTLNISLASNQGLTADKQFELTNTLQEKYADNSLELLSSSDVKPDAGKEFFLKCMVAVLLAFIVTIVYIAFRFKRISGWSAGVFAIIGLIHDIIMVFGAFVIFGYEINANFMAVVLTILGYSINDTIVVYDRIRENKKTLGRSVPVDELVNISITQSITRTINTSITTIAAMLCVSIVATIFGITSILSFSTPLIVGMISGCYSTICICCPLWVMWQKKKKAK
ncbi:MAG: protein translocase subunit SecF [Ruminococcus sp.]|nr:protein translocase subunit SecF [Ruminococcus sp.]